MLRRAVGTALVASLALVACGKDVPERQTRPSTTVAEAPTPEGFRPIRDDQYRFSIAIPNEWRQLPLDAGTLTSQADAVRGTNPQLAETLTSAKDLIGSGGRLFALTPDGSSNINLIVADAGDAALEQLQGPAVAQLQSRGATIESQERTTLGGAKAVKITMKFPISADGKTTVDEVQYYVISKARAYILTLTGHDPALDLIASTMRFL